MPGGAKGEAKGQLERLVIQRRVGTLIGAGPKGRRPLRLAGVACARGKSLTGSGRENKDGHNPVLYTYCSGAEHWLMGHADRR